MTHFHTVYFVLTLIIGISSLSILIVLYLKDKYPLLKAYILFYSSFTLIVFLNSILFYIKTNIENYHTPLFSFLDYIESPFAQYLLMFSLPYFFHKLFNIPNAKKRNLIVAIIAIIMFLLYPFYNYFYDDGSLVNIIGEYIEDIMFVSIIIYSIIIGFIHQKSISNNQLKKTIKFLMILMLIFIPGIYNDTFRSEITSIRFYPLLYWAFSVTFTYYFIKSFLLRETERKTKYVSNSITASNNTDSLLNNYNISEREKEVVALLLEGKSYQQIAEQLFVSVNTVKTHVRKIYPKLGINSRHELVNKINKN